MKAKVIILLVCGHAALSAVAQGALPGSGPVNTGISNQSVALLPTYSIAQRGEHFRRWNHILWRTNDVGLLVARTNSYVELQTAMAYRSGNGWVDSSDQITVTATGAEATNAPHRVAFLGNINTAGAVDLTLPESDSHLRSNILGLSYMDGTGKSVMIAVLQDSIGELLPSGNAAIFPSAFSGVDADVLYVNKIDGLDQLIILRQQLVSPAEYGLDAASSVLQVITEFLDPPPPTLTQQLVDGGWDARVDFGTMAMGKGEAFALDSETNRIGVWKQWLLLDGRTCLVEQVPFTILEPLLKDLPPASAGASMLQAAPELVLHRVADRHLLPKRPLARKDTPALKVANKPLRGKGLALDYLLINTGQSNFTFQGDSTYYISGNVTLSGIIGTTFEGGSIIKFSNGSGLTAISPIRWLGSSYRPVLMVGKDDNTVGETISGSTGNPGNNYYATRALYFDAATANTNLVLQNLRVANAQTAVAINGGAGHVLKHVQVSACQNGMALTNAEVKLRNALFVSVLTNFTGSSATGRVEHLTSDTAAWLNKDIGSNLFLTNSLLVAVTNTGSYTAQNVIIAVSGAGVFQTAVGAGAHYLAAGSTNRAAGTTNISADLAADLKSLTTFPPVVLNHDFTSNTTLSPEVQRDTGIPDIGWNYSPLDFIWSVLNLTNATLTLTNGVAVGFYGSIGLALRAPSTFNSVGTPVNLNHLAWCSAVQEQPSLLGGSAAGYFFDLPDWTSDTTQFPLFSCRFTDMTSLGSQQALLQSDVAGGTVCEPFASWVLQDCSLRAVSFTCFPVAQGCVEVTVPSLICLTNNVFERCNFSMGRVGGCSGINPYAALAIALRNSLFWQGSLTLEYDMEDVNDDFYWNIFDNAFDNLSWGSTSLSSSYINAGNNGYVNISSPFGEANTVLLSSFVYANGPLGPWYQSTTNFINVGSTTANLVGLYHYTVRTNLANGAQIKETNSVVDIGFHYVAVNTSGNPIDSGGGGLADYFKDSNGNGVYDTGDLANWLDNGAYTLIAYIEGRNPRAPGSVADTNRLTQLTVYTPLK